MLAVDASMLLDDRSTAIRTLRGYQPEERRRETGAEVLATVALRIGDWDSAITHHPARSRPTRSLIGCARQRSSKPIDSLSCRPRVAMLDDAVAAGGQDGIEAALFRLAATMKEGATVPWSDDGRGAGDDNRPRACRGHRPGVLHRAPPRRL